MAPYVDEVGGVTRQYCDQASCRGRNLQGSDVGDATGLGLVVLKASTEEQLEAVRKL